MYIFEAADSTLSATMDSATAVNDEVPVSSCPVTIFFLELCISGFFSQGHRSWGLGS